MKSSAPHPNTLSPAQRGLAVQRVIVDGWTMSAAAAAAGVPERFVAAWVADFREDGMASLRQRPGKTIATDYVHRRLLRPARLGLRGIGSVMRWLFALDQPVPPSPIRQSRDDRRGG
ncbi:MAG: helix-turn-helix domain-containing protein [Alphaproteobacteria bacterium]|nr:helix-turn-helix domain-containing protein [Alphaproteobacteria bacterium]